MKSFKIREGNVLIDGILYSESQQSNPIMGKCGKIASIGIGGKQFFPQSGTFDDGSISVSTDDTGIVEETKPTKKKKGLNENR
jgi:hypothetical protein